jgi:hypothetical protein
MRSVIEREDLAGARWKVEAKVTKYRGDFTAEQIDAGVADDAFYGEEISEGNLLLIGGASLLWEAVLGNGGAGALQYLNNANAYLAVGDSSTAEAETQTDLQAATNKTRKGMDATYPLHTDSTGTVGSRSVTLRATFGSTDANHVWAEWGIANASSASRMLNRKVAALGTKASGTTWVFTVTITLNAS